MNGELLRLDLMIKRKRAATDLAQAVVIALSAIPFDVYLWMASDGTIAYSFFETPPDHATTPLVLIGHYRQGVHARDIAADIIEARRERVA